jgi:hypothetical protein
MKEHDPIVIIPFRVGKPPVAGPSDEVVVCVVSDMPWIYE